MTERLFLRLPNTLNIQTELQFFGSIIKIIIWSLSWEFFNPFRGKEGEILKLHINEAEIKIS